MSRPARRLSFRRTLLLAFGGLLTLAVGTQAAFQIGGVPGVNRLGKIDIYRTKTLKEMEVVSELLSQRLRDWTREARADVAALARSPLLISALDTHVSEALLTQELEFFRGAHPHTPSVLLLGPDGSALVSVGAKASHLSDLGFDQEDQLRLTLTGYLETIRLRHLDGDTFVLRIVHQVESALRPGELAGLLVVDRELGDAMVSLLWASPTSWPSGWACTVGVRSEGKVYSLDGTSPEGTLQGFRSSSVAFSPLDASLDGIEGPYEGKSPGGTEVFAFHRQVKLDTGIILALVLTVERQVALAPLWEDLNLQMLLWIILLLGMMGLGLLIANQISRPIKGLTLAAQRIGQGDLSTRVTVAGNSEIDGFTEDFNTMVARLQTYQQDMEGLVAERTSRAVSLQRRQEAILLAVPHLLLEVNREKVTTWSNPAAREFFGDVAVDNEITGPIEVLLEGHTPKLSFETWQRRQDGEQRLLAWWSQAILDEEGRVTGALFSARDITEQRKTEEVLLLTQKMESVGVLAGGIAHDFNNLLGGIYGFLQLAQIKTTDPTVEGYLAKAVSTINRAKGLTGQFLTFAKGGEPVLVPGRLWPFLREEVQFALSGSSIESHFDVADDLWPCLFDQNQIGQVINNLVINAQQAMFKGGHLTVSALNVVSGEAKRQPQERFVRLSFADTGPGIPTDHLKRIFEPFFTTKATGRGLGLASCYSIVHRHGGRLEVESTLGEGTTFHVFLQACELPVAKAELSVEAVAAPGEGTFVVMDDEPMLGEILQEALQSQGCRVIVTTTGEAALETLAELQSRGQLVKGVFADLTVHHGMGGLDLVAEVRKIDASIPVYVVSGYAEDPVMAAPRSFGFAGSLAKPFLMADILRLIRPAKA